MKQKESIYRRVGDLVVKMDVESKDSTSRVLGSIFIALSGFILYLDKALVLFGYEFNVPQKFLEKNIDFQFFFWLLCQTVSPLFLVAGGIFRTYKLAYLIPIYCYTLQIYFILFDNKLVDDDYIIIYSVGTALLIYLVIYGIKYLLHYLFQRKIASIKKELKAKVKNA